MHCTAVLLLGGLVFISFHEGYSSLGVGVLFADGAAKVVCNVVFQKFNIKRPFGIDERGIPEHCHSAALREQMVVETRKDIYPINKYYRTPS